MKKIYTKIMLTIAIMLFFLWLIIIGTNPHSIARATLLLIWTSLVLTEGAILWRKKPYSPIITLLSFYAGSILLLLFFIWIFNGLLRLFNFLFSTLNWEFTIGTIFGQLSNFIFSWPALICGIILMISSYISQCDLSCRLFKFQ